MRVLANDLGLRLTMTYALNSLKVGLISCAIKAPGSSTLLMNLCLPPLAEPHNIHVSKWLLDYIASTKYNVRGFSPADGLVDRSFQQAAIQFASSGIILLGAQIDGILKLNPSEAIVTKGTILFGAMDSEDKLGK